MRTTMTIWRATDEPMSAVIKVCHMRIARSKVARTVAEAGSSATVAEAGSFVATDRLGPQHHGSFEDIRIRLK